MITIYKYQFELVNQFEIEMPLCAIILSIQEKQGKWTIWARVDTELPNRKRKFVAFWTGEELPRGYSTLNYIATVQDYYVWHIFEQVNLLNPASGQSGINNMLLDPNEKQATEEVKAAGQDVQAVEQEAQEQALESAEEGGTEG